MIAIGFIFSGLIAFLPINGRKLVDISCQGIYNGLMNKIYAYLLWR